ncbi:MAG: nucleoside triphosphate pyrophosphohydrolase [Nitrospirae bacterium]|nr:nucleoside triphosphate pyrophosphohydrolase [Nitrospirota bacterium]MBF0533550.1 nucleoside triphosphate pyrophosphohydrolase [Nitrospirota bacterium]MBF0615926.1 nucleoside triphosphate pyrophosphohydrolase [Nitrospirota bacterium]
MSVTFDQLVAIVERLRSKDGCPWDKEQTAETIVNFLIEESYEVVDSIEEKDHAKIKEELGDLLFQILFLARIGTEEGHFTIEDVIEGISTKMISRHPHVFGQKVCADSEEVLKQWYDIKKSEGRHDESILNGVSKSLPALLRAQMIQSRASRVGFDWQTINDVSEKLDEEIAEFKSALTEEGPSSERVEDELGDLLFTIVNISRFLKLNPEAALRKTTNRFIRRFKYIEDSAKALGKSLDDMTLAEMDSFWQKAKDCGL